MLNWEILSWYLRTPELGSGALWFKLTHRVGCCQTMYLTIYDWFLQRPPKNLRRIFVATLQHSRGQHQHGKKQKRCLNHQQAECLCMVWAVSPYRGVLDDWTDNMPTDWLWWFISEINKNLMLFLGLRYLLHGFCPINGIQKIKHICMFRDAIQKKKQDI